MYKNILNIALLTLLPLKSTAHEVSVIDFVNRSIDYVSEQVCNVDVAKVDVINTLFSVIEAVDVQRGSVGPITPENPERLQLETLRNRLEFLMRDLATSSEIGGEAKLKIADACRYFNTWKL